MSLSKRIIIIVICVLTVLSSAYAIIAGVVGKSQASAKSPTSNATVVKVNGEKIPYSDFYELLDYYMMSWYGVSSEYLDAYFGVQYGNTIRESVIEELIDKSLAMQNAGEYGYDKLVGEAEAEVDSYVESFYEDTRTSIAESVTSEYTDEDGNFLLTDDEFRNEVEKQLKSFLEESGYTDEYLHKYYTDYVKINRVYSAVVEDIDITDEKIEEYYNKLLAEQKKMAEDDPETAMMYYSNDYNDVNVYVPGELKHVQQILIQISEEKLEELAAIEDEAEYEKKLKEYQDELLPEAEEAWAKLESGVPFEEVMDEYSDDEYMKEEPYKSEGYVVYKDSGYVKSFEKAALNMVLIDQTSGLVRSEYGFHILRLFKITEAGEIPLEEVKDEIRAYALTDLQNSAWEAKIAEWRENAKIKKYEDRYLSVPEPSAESTATAKSLTE